MTEQETKGNKLIAVFMGMVPADNGNYFWETSEKIIGRKVDDLQYHYSWEWLMKVVEKIEDLTISAQEQSLHSDKMNDVEWSFEVCIKGRQCMISRNVLPQFYGTENDFLELYDCRYQENEAPKENIVFTALVEFIKWYNKNAK